MLLVVKYFDVELLLVIYELYQSQRQKTYLRTCTPIGDSDQPAHSDQNRH